MMQAQPAIHLKEIKVQSLHHTKKKIPDIYMLSYKVKQKS